MTGYVASSFPALGTTALVLTTDFTLREQATAILREELDAIDLACSRFREDSELMAVNGSKGRPVPVSDLFLQSVRTALRVAALTEGAVDPTVGRAMRLLGYDRDFSEIAGPAVQLAGDQAAVPADWRAVEVDLDRRTIRVPADVELDLGATAKALCADRAAAAIAHALGAGCLVSLGGDIATAGHAPSGGWLVRVTDDHSSSASADGQTVSLSGGGLATSSITVRRWRATDGSALHHIVDPRTGKPAARIWRTATVTAGSCVDANAASTLAIVRGEGAPAWLRRHLLPSRLVRPSGDVELVADWPVDDAAEEAA